MTDDYTGPEATLVPGTLRGYRRWSVGPDGTLYSVSAEFRWEKVVRARCLWSPVWRGVPQDHGIEEAPKLTCTCGIYAMYDTEQTWHCWSTTIISGVVDCHGRIIMGSIGFRAEVAQIRAVYRPPTWPKVWPT